MTTKADILRLQQLYFDIEDVQEYTPKNLELVVQLLKRYQQILLVLSQRSPDDFDHLFYVGLEEIIDHLCLMKNASTHREKKKCYSDLQFYFQQSVIDARSKLVQGRSKITDSRSLSR